MRTPSYPGRRTGGGKGVGLLNSSRNYVTEKKRIRNGESDKEKEIPVFPERKRRKRR